MRVFNVVLKSFKISLIFSSIIVEIVSCNSLSIVLNTDVLKLFFDPLLNIPKSNPKLLLDLELDVKELECFDIILSTCTVISLFRFF